MNDGASDPDGAALTRTVARLVAADRTARLLGISVTTAAAGNATAAMTVTDAMLNGHDVCHGGLVATLADTALAFAANAEGVAAVTAAFSIDLLAPARLGDRLTASATRAAARGRTSLYDVTVANQRGECVAVFHGRARAASPTAAAT